MVLHGTGGSGKQFLRPQFADVLFKPGGLLDPAKYFIILPDGIGHGQSSKPSDGLRAKFPHYDYDDMVRAQHLLLTQGLKVDGLRLLMGTSMGCMHGFVWGETYPGFAKALMPLACQPVEIAGRNRLWRKMLMDAITTDPAWQGGDYTAQPIQGLRTAQGLLMIAGAAPLPMQNAYPTREAADKYLADDAAQGRRGARRQRPALPGRRLAQLRPVRDLEKITVPVMWINSGRRHDQPARARHRRARGEAAEAGDLRPAARDGPDQGPRLPHLGGAVAGPAEGAARPLRRLRREGSIGG